MLTVLMLRTVGYRPIALLLSTAFLAAVACSPAPAKNGPIKVVAAFYPLAWAAGEVTHFAEVEDLTPPGGEPHDIQLNARQRIDIQTADVVLLLGKGFQPEVEKAARDARGRVVDLLAGLPLLPSKERGIQADPHVWLDPVLMRDIAKKIVDVLSRADPPMSLEIQNEGRALDQKLAAVNDAYEGGLQACALRTLVTTHEAFEYLAKRYGLTQIGLTGVSPEAEPSAASIQRVRTAAARGEVGAIFYEATDEGRRIGTSVARDVGVPALPLNTLESDPSPKDYQSQMQANLDSLRKGLRCR